MRRIVFQILIIWGICIPSAIADAWDLFDEVDTLHSGGTSTLTSYFSRPVLEDLVNVYHRLSQQSGVASAFLISADNTMNAYAFKERGQAIIVLTIPIIKALEHDVDALAAVIGHELGHLKLDHHFSGQMTNTAIDLLKSAVSTSNVLADIATDLGSSAAKGFYSREDEYEADAAGVRYMIAAGYDPAGAIRTHQILNNPNSSFFSTHPSSDERISKLHALSGHGKNTQPTDDNHSSNINSRLPACIGTNTLSWGNCYGIATWSNGTKYEGEWRNGQAQGQGKFLYMNGDRYVGQIVNGKAHGYGTYTWGHGKWAGDKYAGQFNSNHKHGQGTYFFSNGVIQKGVFANNQFQYAKEY